MGLVSQWTGQSTGMVYFLQYWTLLAAVEFQPQEMSASPESLCHCKKQTEIML
jgi:hypothetical protein